MNSFTARGTVGHGKLAVNALGYRTVFINRVLARESLEDRSTISAHAPSLVQLHLTAPATIYGFLNCSARMYPDNPVTFWADYNCLGSAAGPGDRTREVPLEPGDHLLHVDCLKECNEWRHSIWALHETASEPSTSSPVATEDNTAVMVLAAYPFDQVPMVLLALASCAAKQGIWLQVRGVNESYSHFDSKVLRMSQWIEELPVKYRYVLYLDARDTLIIRPLQAICDQFNGFASPVVISAGRCCHPVREPAWADRFPSHPSGRCWINAGTWVGERHAVAESLRKLAEIREALEGPTANPGLESCRCYRHFRDDDQFLWQVAYLTKAFDFAVDHDSKITANVGSADKSIPENRDFRFEAGRLKVIGSGAEPGILHFSGSAGEKYRDQWAGYLGALV